MIVFGQPSYQPGILNRASLAYKFNPCHYFIVINKYCRNMKQTLLISIVFAVLFIILNQFLFWGDWYFLIYSLVPGVLIPFFQKREKSLQIIPAIIVGSIVYGFLALVSVELLHVLNTEAPFNWPVILQASLIYAVMCFIGGLVGIVLKGFTALQNKV